MCVCVCLCVGVDVGGCFYGYTTEDKRENSLQNRRYGGGNGVEEKCETRFSSSRRHHVPFASVRSNVARGEGEKRGHERLFHKGS